METLRLHLIPSLQITITTFSIIPSTRGLETSPLGRWWSYSNLGKRFWKWDAGLERRP